MHQQIVLVAGAGRSLALGAVIAGMAGLALAEPRPRALRYLGPTPHRRDWPRMGTAPTPAHPGVSRQVARNLARKAAKGKFVD